MKKKSWGDWEKVLHTIMNKTVLNLALIFLFIIDKKITIFENVATMDTGGHFSIRRSGRHGYSFTSFHIANKVKLISKLLLVWLRDARIFLNFKRRWQKIFKSRLVLAMTSYASLYFNVILVALVLLLLGKKI